MVGMGRWVGHGQVGVVGMDSGCGRTSGWGWGVGGAAHCNKGVRYRGELQTQCRGESENQSVTGEYDLVALFSDPGCL